MADIRASITRPSQIIANTSGITRTQSNPAIELKNNLPAITQNYLASLLDVDVKNQTPVGGEVLTYNATTGKYDLEPLPTGTIALDGGNF
jgi:hypothetical protein